MAQITNESSALLETLAAVYLKLVQTHTLWPQDLGRIMAPLCAD